MSNDFKNKIKQDRLYNIDFLRVLAILLIINSHFDALYPISALATGGALGNSLFFILSGYLIRYKNKNISYFLNFLIRLYLPLYFVYIIFFIQCGESSNHSIVQRLIWPTDYWFIGAILLFYILYTCLEKIGMFNHFIHFVVIMTAVYFFYYFAMLDTSKWVVESPGLADLNGSFKLIYYFLIMMFGGYLRDKKRIRIKMAIPSLTWITPVIIMYLSKYLMDRYEFLMHFQFLSQLCTLIFAVNILGWSFQSDLLNKLMKNDVFCKVVLFLSSVSLECYLVQFSIIELCKEIFFPANIVIAVLLIILSGETVKIITDIAVNVGEHIFKRIRKRISS